MIDDDDDGDDDEESKPGSLKANDVSQQHM
jgi:hypothetical protein